MVVKEGMDRLLRHFGRQLGFHGCGTGSLIEHFLHSLMGGQRLTNQTIKARKQQVPAPVGAFLGIRAQDERVLIDLDVAQYGSAAPIIVRLEGAPPSSRHPLGR